MTREDVAVAGRHTRQAVLDMPVTVDRTRGVVRIPAGARWGEVVAAAASEGLAVPHASDPAADAVGDATGAGHGPYARLFGVVPNNVLAVTVELADGTVTVVDAEHDADLFWALRGGDSGLGTIRAIELTAVAAAGVVTGTTVWDADEAGKDVARAWWDWTRTAPHTATTSLRLLSHPGAHGIPGAPEGRPVLEVTGSVLAVGGDPDLASSVVRRMLDPLRGLATPLLDTWDLAGLAGPAVLTDPVGSATDTTDAFLLREGGHDLIDCWTESVGRASRSGLRVAELRQLGGALAVEPVFAGAFGSVAEPLAALNIWSAGTPAQDVPRDGLAEVRERLRPWVTTRTTALRLDDAHLPRPSFDREIAARLEAVRRRVDPDRVSG